ncbi:MAG: MBL fold metallo-hydrolase [Elusimicrobia bacterium]|nr:MBL fold metallo-hydrolase [Elusimicrobiota bacterium]
MVKNLFWLGHASFRIEGSKTIYIDPYNLKEEQKKADIVCVTHSHYDHLSVKDIKKIADDKTVIVAPVDASSKLSGKVKKVNPGDVVEVEGVKIEVYPAYNTNKTFHPKSNNWVGYVIEMDGRRIYHAGDTDFIEEMKNLKNIDIALLPVSGTFVMTSEEAAAAAKTINPKIAVPMHWGAGIVGDRSDAENFGKLLEGIIETKILL